MGLAVVRDLREARGAAGPEVSCLIQTEARDANVRHPGRRLAKVRQRPSDLVRQHRGRIDLSHDRRDDRRPQPSQVLEAPQLSALPVPHDQEDRTRRSRTTASPIPPPVPRLHCPPKKIARNDNHSAALRKHQHAA
jgi:hypothetical protein